MILTRTDLWTFLFAGFVISVSVMAGLWLVFDTSFGTAMIAGLFMILLFLGYADGFISHVRENASERHVRARIAKLETRLKPDQHELMALREELAELEQKKGYRGQ